MAPTPVPVPVPVPTPVPTLALTLEPTPDPIRVKLEDDAHALAERNRLAQAKAELIARATAAEALRAQANARVKQTKMANKRHRDEEMEARATEIGEAAAADAAAAVSSDTPPAPHSPLPSLSSPPLPPVRQRTIGEHALKAKKKKQTKTSKKEKEKEEEMEGGAKDGTVVAPPPAAVATWTYESFALVRAEMARQRTPAPFPSGLVDPDADFCDRIAQTNEATLVHEVEERMRTAHAERVEHMVARAIRERPSYVVILSRTLIRHLSHLLPSSGYDAQRHLFVRPATDDPTDVFHSMVRDLLAAVDNFYMRGSPHMQRERNVMLRWLSLGRQPCALLREPELRNAPVALQCLIDLGYDREIALAAEKQPLADSFLCEVPMQEFDVQRADTDAILAYCTRPASSAGAVMSLAAVHRVLTLECRALVSKLNVETQLLLSKSSTVARAMWRAEVMQQRGSADPDGDDYDSDDDNGELDRREQLDGEAAAAYKRRRRRVNARRRKAAEAKVASDKAFFAAMPVAKRRKGVAGVLLHDMQCIELHYQAIDVAKAAAAAAVRAHEQEGAGEMEIE